MRDARMLGQVRISKRVCSENSPLSISPPGTSALAHINRLNCQVKPPPVHKATSALKPKASTVHILINSQKSRSASYKDTRLKLSHTLNRHTLLQTSDSTSHQATLFLKLKMQHHPQVKRDCTERDDQTSTPDTTPSTSPFHHTLSHQTNNSTSHNATPVLKLKTSTVHILINPPKRRPTPHKDTRPKPSHTQ